MYDNVFSAFNCFKSFFDQFRTRLYQYLNRYIIGNMMPFDQSAQDLIFGFRCRRKTNFYFFKSKRPAVWAIVAGGFVVTAAFVVAVMLLF